MGLETQLDTVVLAILIAGMMPLMCAAIAKWGRKDYDNHNPRAWMAKLDGFRARANAAQENCLEAFPFFAVGVILAALGGADGDALETVSWLFILARTGYVVCYLQDRSSLRTLLWIIGYGCVINLYVMALV